MSERALAKSGQRVERILVSLNGQEIVVGPLFSAWKQKPTAPVGRSQVRKGSKLQLEQAQWVSCREPPAWHRNKDSVQMKTGHIKGQEGQGREGS